MFVLVSVPRDCLRCRSCGCRRVHLHEWRQRFWKAAPLGLTPVFVTMKTPRVKCLQCGGKTWHQPAFVEGQRRITKGFERGLEAWLSRLTIQDAVEVFGVSWNTVCEIDIRRLKKLSRPGLTGLRRLAIDEVYLGKRHKFVTLVVDLDTRAVVSVAPGRGQAGLQGFFLRLKRADAKIEAVATDMAGGYIAAVLKYLPKARLVFDPAVERTGPCDQADEREADHPAPRPAPGVDRQPASRRAEGNPLAAAQESREPDPE